ncbi:hypothetical protein KQY30_13460 [Streptomyces sp. GMY02]|uniref:hypothetical protein n=1 Tax=Streptomyces sp. GMY02 TaxID=1333528 RepID=UPI001C2C3148|nr:hypothetical protein [Streptomyces sp. GMY02]QXE35127.1 hypothetical protein KQY30_13460 [Streptomyces sp. GMY02]
MQDRRRRTAPHLPPPAGPVLLPRERQSSSTGPSGTPGPSGSPGASGSADSEQDRAAAGGPAGGSGTGAGAGTGPASGTGAGSGTTGSGGSSGSSGSGGPGSPAGSPGPGSPSDDNPFAPPPEGRPDQPWRPRRPEGGPGDGGSGSDRSGWGSQWSSRQPGRSPDGFGSRPGGRDGQNGRDGGQDGPEGGRGGGLRWDPTDPIQRRARYALLGGMWAFFFALFDFPEIALLLGSLALYWGASALRNKPADGSSRDGRDGRQNPALTGAASRNTAGTPTATAGTAAQPAPAPGHTAGAPFPSASSASNRQQTTAAVSGLVTAGIALAIVAATFTVQLVYRDYYTCLNDALTKTGQLSCNDELPRSLVPVFGVKE